MKYRIIGLGACLLTLFLAVLAPLALSNHAMEPRVHQHKGALPETECGREGEGLCTYLPIVCIDTSGMEIPGRPIRNTQTGESVYSLAPDGQTTIPARMRIVGTDTSVYHHPEDPAALESQIRIRIRGNSSRSFEKPSYAIRLVHEDGSNNAQSVMGMPEHHEWALYGP